MPEAGGRTGGGWNQELGLADYERLIKCNLVVAHAEIDFVSPARFDDLLIVFVRVSEIGRTSLTTRIEVCPDRTDRLVFRGRFVHVNIDDATGKPVPVPANVRDIVQAFEPGIAS